MSDPDTQEIGSITWTDLTVQDAAGVRDFYAQVVGWQPEAGEMGEYSDFNMTMPASGKAAAGVCYARGVNADLPPLWLVYITVADIDQSVAKCLALGGKVIHGPRGMPGQGRICVIQDPAGAVAALYELARE